MRCSPTTIELLNVKHPGLERDVCNWMKVYMSGAEISRRLSAKYQESVCVRTVNTYRKIRYQREQDAITERKRHVKAIAQAVGEDGLDAGTLANLWEALQTMSPRELIALRRLQLDREQMKVLNKRAENSAQRLKEKLAQVKNGGKQRPRDMEELRRRIGEIYGIGKHRSSSTSTPSQQGVSQSGDERPQPGENEGAEGESDVQGSMSETNASEAESPESASAGRSDHPACSGAENSDSVPSPGTGATAAE